MRKDYLIVCLVWLTILRGGSLHEAKIHIVASFHVGGLFSSFQGNLFLDPCVLLPVYEAEWVVLKGRGNAVDTARKKVELVFARVAKAQHPDLRFCCAVPCDWYILSGSAVLHGRCWGSNTKHRSSGALIVVLHGRGEVVEVILFDKGKGEHCQEIVAPKGNQSGFVALVTHLRPVMQRLAGCKNCLGRDNGLCRIFAEVAQLVVIGPFARGRGRSPCIVQKLLSVGLLPFVANEMGKGAFGVTLMRLIRLPVRHMFAPPSMR